MTFSALLKQAEVEPREMIGDAEISSVVMDSRRASPGSLFVCMPGLGSDSELYIPDASLNGAKSALVYSEHGVESAVRHSMAVAMVSPEQFADAVWPLCRAFYDSPTRNMKVVGVTGTNGKTTTAWLLRDMLRALGVRAGYLGTLGLHLPDEERELANTTPFAVELYGLLAEARDAGTEALAMEVSSHALHEKRADGVEFDAAIFTNLTQDHLDYHGSMESYEEAKLRLFTDLPLQTAKSFVAVINSDDSTGAHWMQKLHCPVIDYSLGPGHALSVYAKEVAVDHIHMELEHGSDRIDVQAPLGGHFNVYNCAAASAGLLALGYTLKDVAVALPQVRPVPGRFEAVRSDTGIGVIVDYAHTPDALEKLLESVEELHPSRIITVFGCGGDRDRTKRPKMARAVSERSDLTIVTSDNPRTEDPEKIIEEIRAGIVSGRQSLAIIDRREAIAKAIHLAAPDDVVVIAGKGHENYQIIGKTKHPMDDRDMAREALAGR